MTERKRFDMLDSDNYMDLSETSIDDAIFDPLLEKEVQRVPRIIVSDDEGSKSSEAKTKPVGKLRRAPRIIESDHESLEQEAQSMESSEEVAEEIIAKATPSPIKQVQRAQQSVKKVQKKPLDTNNNARVHRMQLRSTTIAKTAQSEALKEQRRIQSQQRAQKLKEPTKAKMTPAREKTPARKKAKSKAKKIPAIQKLKKPRTRGRSTTRKMTANTAASAKSSTRVESRSAASRQPPNLSPDASSSSIWPPVEYSPSQRKRSTVGSVAVHGLANAVDSVRIRSNSVERQPPGLCSSGSSLKTSPRFGPSQKKKIQTPSNTSPTISPNVPSLQKLPESSRTATPIQDVPSPSISSRARYESALNEARFFSTAESRDSSNGRSRRYSSRKSRTSSPLTTTPEHIHTQSTQQHTPSVASLNSSASSRLRRQHNDPTSAAVSPIDIQGSSLNQSIEQQKNETIVRVGDLKDKFVIQTSLYMELTIDETDYVVTVPVTVHKPRPNSSYKVNSAQFI